MEAYKQIILKLLQFSKKYYTTVLIKGTLLFVALALIFFLLTLSIEYFLWLNSVGRFVLLFVFLLVQTYLLVRFIIIPLAFLFRIKKGITDKDASIIIGKHFTEVDDKLLNLLELADDRQKTELLLASIEQRSAELRPVPFNRAINYGDNIKYAKYLLIPVLILGLIWLSGNLKSFFNSYERVLHYDVAYDPPAPFTFRVMMGELSVLETEEITVRVATEGRIQPEEVDIVINDRAYLMQVSNGVFHYTFSPPLADSEFYFESNGIRSQTYLLKSLNVPAIQDFKLVLNYPDYTGKNTEILNSTGNATFPEGTRVRWEINGKNTEEIALIYLDTLEEFNRDENLFSLSKSVYNSLDYQLATSNTHAKRYEKLNYRFKVIKDNQPAINATEVIDSINPNFRYYEGEASDDYELVSIRLICYPSQDKEDKQVILLDSPQTNFKQFYYTFPSGLRLVEGTSYDFYFEAVDNDAIKGGKSAKSKVFTTRVLDDNELNNKQLDFQRSILEDLDNSLDNYRKQEESLEEINKEQKEKNTISFNDQNKIKDFLKKQEQQEKMMQKFSRQLKENLEEGQNDERMNDLLRERLERQEMEARKNEKLLEELKKIADKLDKEELTKRLDELAKNQKNNERNLEQLLELTKRYYVTEKAAQLARDLEKLAERQESLSEKSSDSTSVGNQQELNDVFEELAKELEMLKKDNNDLKKPLPLEIDGKKEDGIKEDQKEAKSELEKEMDQREKGNDENAEQNKSNAQRKQKSASQKLRQMSEDLQESSSMAAGGSSITEDAEMLRQILDNLITFSFKQESLFEELEESDPDISYFSEKVREQKELKSLFEHVDDSLFALSLRRAELSEFVNEQINEVYYNMDKSVESIVEGRIYQGVSYQQYVLTAANNLADFLANVLDNMQQSMKAGSGSGGQGSDFQLPDIIKGQQELKDKMGQMSGSGQSGEQGESKEGDGQKGDVPQSDGDKQGTGEEGQVREGNEKKGNRGDGENSGEGKGMGTEENLSELYEIYKEQQRLRELLEKQLNDLIRSQDRQLAQKLIQQMEDFENELLRSGITERTISKMNNIEHQLLKLENAALSQGKKEERKSRTNEEIYTNPITTKPDAFKRIKNDVEILNRQALPLQQNFQEKVKTYFNAKD